MNALLSLLWERLIAGVCTWPTSAGWALTAVLLVVTGAVSYVYGRRSGFLVLAPPLPRAVQVRVWVTAWFAPAFVEEILFRVLPLPHRGEAVPRPPVALAMMYLALAVFVLAHPLRTWVKPTPGNAVFTDKRFLTLAALLGGACSLAYLATGSVWAPTLLHCVLVGSWLTRFGGLAKVAP